MKSVLEEKEEVLSSTPNSHENILDLESKTYVLDDTDKLAADNEVSVLETIISDDKSLRNSFSCDDNVDCIKDPLLIEDTVEPVEAPNLNGESDFSENLTNQNSSALNPKVVLVRIDSSDFFNEDNNIVCYSINETCDTRLRARTIEQSKEVKNSEILSKKLKYLKKLPSMSSKTKNHNSHPDSKNSGNGVKRKSQAENNVVAKKIKKEEVNTNKNNNKNFKSNKKPENAKNSVYFNSGSKEGILYNDPELPSGWTRFIRTRDKGTPVEKHFVYIVSPQGKKFRYKWKLRRYLEKTKSDLHPDQFFFGLYKRNKPSVPKLESKDGLSDRNIRSGTLLSPDSDKSVKLGLKELLKFDPDLPFGWKRIVNANKNSGKLQVHIISPEGRIFRRRYRLSEYLTKHQYNLDVDRFHFGLYPKKEPNGDSCHTSDEVSSKPNSTGDPSPDETKEFDTSNYDQVNSISDTDEENDGEDVQLDLSNSVDGSTPLFIDPYLPKGWSRFIRVRSYGGSAGRMEVVIVSPDGRRHRSKGQLDHYLKQKKLSYNADDFDFTVFGKNRKRPEVIHPEEVFSCLRRKFKSILNDNPVPDLDISSLNEPECSAEGKAINAVNGLMISSGISTPRNERRSRVPRKEHEKIIKLHLESEEDVKSEDCDVPAHWVQRLAKCRSEIRPLEPDAASAIANRTKEFLGELCQQALKNSSDPDCELQYNDLADVVEKFECLSPLKTLIPQKITFRKFIKLNRPKQFMSFT